MSSLIVRNIIKREMLKSVAESRAKADFENSLSKAEKMLDKKALEYLVPKMFLRGIVNNVLSLERNKTCHMMPYDRLKFALREIRKNVTILENMRNGKTEILI